MLDFEIPRLRQLSPMPLAIRSLATDSVIRVFAVHSFFATEITDKDRKIASKSFGIVETTAIAHFGGTAGSLRRVVDERQRCVTTEAIGLALQC